MKEEHSKGTQNHRLRGGGREHCQGRILLDVDDREPTPHATNQELKPESREGAPGIN